MNAGRLDRRTEAKAHHGDGCFPELGQESQWAGDVLPGDVPAVRSVSHLFEPVPLPE